MTSYGPTSFIFFHNVIKARWFRVAEAYITVAGVGEWASGNAWAEYLDTYHKDTSALWFYDYIQTLPMEITVAWSRKPTGAAVIFLINRYAFGIYLTLQLAFQMPGSASDLRYLHIVTIKNLVSLIHYFYCSSCSVLDIMEDCLNVVSLGMINCEL